MKTNFLTALLLSVATQSVSAVQLEAGAAVEMQGISRLMEAQLETSSSAASESEVESEWPWSTC